MTMLIQPFYSFVTPGLVPGVHSICLSEQRAFDSFRGDYQAMNAVYRSYFKEGRLPARTCIGVSALAHDVLVEIDFIARRPA